MKMKTKWRSSGKGAKKGRAKTQDEKLRCSVSRGRTLSTGLANSLLVNSRFTVSRSHLRPAGTSRVRLHAHATGGLFKVLLTSEPRGYRVAFGHRLLTIDLFLYSFTRGLRTPRGVFMEKLFHVPVRSFINFAG